MNLVRSQSKNVKKGIVSWQPLNRLGKLWEGSWERGWVWYCPGNDYKSDLGLIHHLATASLVISQKNSQNNKDENHLVANRIVFNDFIIFIKSLLILSLLLYSPFFSTTVLSPLDTSLVFVLIHWHSFGQNVTNCHRLSPSPLIITDRLTDKLEGF